MFGSKSRKLGASAVAWSKREDRDLLLILIDGFFYSLMVGAGETYLAAFILAKSGSPVWAGVATALPMAFGGILQIFTPRFWAFGPSLRAWTVVWVTLQALCFVPLVWASLDDTLPLWVSVLAIVAYWTTGMTANPGWNAWVNQLVPRGTQQRFFSLRQGLNQIAIVIALLGVGFWLRGHSEQGFAIPFALAGIFRLTCALLLRMHSSPRQTRSLAPVGFRGLARSARVSTHFPWLLGLVAVAGGVNLAGPFFHPYQLGVLGLSYPVFAAQLACFYLAKTVMYQWLRRKSEMSSNGLLLWGALGVTPLPFLWLIYDAGWYFALVQAFSAVAWSALEFAGVIGMLRIVHDDERAAVIAAYNVANACAIALSSAIGGAILMYGHQSSQIFVILFVLGGLLRLAAWLWTRRLLANVKAASV